MSTAGEGDQSTATQHASLPFVLSEEQLSSARNAGVWTKTATNSIRKLLESRSDKAVNDELQNLYDILLVSVESEFDVTGQAVADFQIETVPESNSETHNNPWRQSDVPQGHPLSTPSPWRTVTKRTEWLSRQYSGSDPTWKCRVNS
jgi:hypothetical protein